MPLFGKIVVIKRNGTDGIHFPLTASSCLFGRKTECDIRIQLPQVSKEHCKIEVNENKEAILINLSTVNPTQLNGNSFQQPAHLKHGDMFTIVDRSFRFEYPPQSAPRKRHSRTPKNETLQVLHVQQAAEVELQSPRSKSPRTSDKNVESEAQNFGENDKQTTQEDISRAVPAKQHVTPKSTHRTAKSNRKENEMSPFSKLYDLLKHEIDVKTQKDGNEKILKPQQAEANAKQTSLLTCPSSQESQATEKETIIGEDIEQSEVKKQEINKEEYNQISAHGIDSTRFSGSLRTSFSKDKPGDIQDGRHLQDSVSTQERRVSGNSEGIKITTYIATKVNRENEQNGICSPKVYFMESLDCIDKICPPGQPIEQTINATNKESLTDISKTNKYSVSTPKYKRKSLLANSSPSASNNEVRAANSSASLTGQDLSLGEKAREISTEIQKKDVVCSVGENESHILGESKYSKSKKNSKQLTSRKSLNAEEVLKEIHDTHSGSITTERDSETVNFSPGYNNSKSPKGSVRQSRRFSNKSQFSEVLTPERLTPKDASSASCNYHSGARRRRRASSGKMVEEALERDPSEKHDKNMNIKDSSVKEKLATENYQQKLNVQDANIVLAPHRLSSKRRHSESVALLKDNQVLEMNISSLPVEEKKSGETKRSPQKRKSGELEMLLQPLGKRKRVSFGGHLSPELFDKSLPPNSPLKRGAIPARLSLPFGGSPRAVLKKGPGFKHLVVKDLSEQLQREKSSQENLPSRRSLAATQPDRKSPPTRSSLATSPPTLEKTPPKSSANSSSNTSLTKGRFSISHISTPSPTSKEQHSAATEVNENERDFTGVKTPESFHINQEQQVSVPTTPKQLRRSIRFSAKRTPMKRRSDVVETIHSKRRSGASKANLLVAKSWAEVVKLGVARPQVKAVKKRITKGRSGKKLTKSPKIQAREVVGHFSTGHADSPATIVIGRAHTTRVKPIGQAPRVVKNYALKQNMDISESFTGMTEMFRTPVKENPKSPSLSTTHKTDLSPPCIAVEVSEVHTPEETGEMVISPLSPSGTSQQREDNQDVVSHFLKVMKSPNSTFVDVTLKQTSKNEKTILEQKRETSDLLVMPHKHVTDVIVGAKRFVKTPTQKTEPSESLSAVKRLMRTPKQKTEPAEALSGVKRLMRTPKQKTEPAEALSGVKRLMRTPKQKTEPAEALSGVKRLLRTPKQKMEPVEALSGVKRLLRTPKQKMDPIEVLSGIKRLLRTPEQKTEPPIDEIALKRLLNTPEQKEQIVNDLLGVSFMKTAQKQKCQPAEDTIGISHTVKTSKQRIQSEDTIRIRKVLKTPKERIEPVEDIFDISRLLRTPREKYPPVDDFVGLQKLMAEPKKKFSSCELDYIGVKEIFDTPKEIKVKVMDLVQENNSHIDPKSEHELGDNCEREELKQEKRLEESFEKTPSTFVRSKNRNTKNKQELQEKFEHACVSPKDSDIVKNVESIEKMIGSETESYNLSNSVSSPLLTTMDAVQKPSMQQQGELNQRLKDSNDKELLFENSVAPHLNLMQGSDDLSSKDKTSTRIKQQKIEKEYSSSLLKDHEDLKENVNLLELSVRMKEIEEQKEEAVTFTSAVKNLGRKETTDQYMQEDISKTCVPKQFDKNKEAVLSIEINKTFHSSKRSKRDFESHSKDPLMPKRETTTMKENLQTIPLSVSNHILIMKNDQSVQTANVSSANENIVGHPSQIGLIAPEDKSDQSSVENNKNVIVSIRRSSRREKKIEMVESLVPAKRSRRGKTEDNKQVSMEECDAKEKSKRQTERKHCTAETEQCMQADEQDFAKAIIEATAVEESEVNKLPLEIMVTEKKGRKYKFRKPLGETKKGSIEQGLENVSILQETQETSKETPNSIKNKTQEDQGNKEGGQSSALKESCVENTNEIPLSLPANRNSFKKTNLRLGNKRGKKGILDNNEGEFAKSEELVSQNISETKPESVSTKNTPDSLRAGQSSNTKEVRSNPTAAMVYSPKYDERIVLRRGKRIRKSNCKQEASETKQIPTKAHENILKRDREIKVHFEIEEASSLRGKHILSESNDKDQNIPSQANENLSRRGRRKKDDLTSLAVSFTSLREEYSLSEIDAKEETPKQDQNLALESVSPTIEKPSRRGRRKQVDLKVLAASSRAKCSLPGDSVKEEISKNQNMPLETTVMHSEEKLSRRGRRNEVSLTSQAASSSSLPEKSSWTENDKEVVPKDQNMPLGNIVSQVKANPSGKGRRKQAELTARGTSSMSLRGKSILPENDGKEKVPEEDQNMPLGNTDEAKANPSRKGRRKQVDLATQAASCTSLRRITSLPEHDGKEKVSEEDQSVPSGNTVEAKANPSRKGRRKQVDLATQAASCTSLRGITSLPENDDKDSIPKEDKNVLLGNTATAKANSSRKGRRKQVDLPAQASSCTSLRGIISLPEHDDKEKVPEEDQNMPSGNTIEAKANPSRKGRRKQVDLTTQAASCTSFKRITSLPENDNKDNIPKEDKVVILGNTATAKANSSRKGRRKQVDLPAQASSCTSLRGIISLPEHDDKEKVPEEDQNMPAGNTVEAKANPSRKGRRKQVDLTRQADSCTSLRGITSLPEDNGKENIPKEDQNVTLGNTAKTKANPSKKGRGKQVDLTTEEDTCTFLRGKSNLPQSDGKETLPEKDQNVPLGNTAERKSNQSSKGRRKQVDLTTQAASCTSLRGKGLPEKEDKEKTPKEGQHVSLGNSTLQSSKKGRRKQLDLTTQADSLTSLGGKSCLPENYSKENTPKEDQNVCLENTTLETKANPSRKGRGKLAELPSQTASSTSLRGKRHLPEDEKEAKKLKAEYSESTILQKETRSKTKEKLEKCGISVIQSAGGTERKTRASARARK